MGVCTQTAEATLFLQFEDDSEMEGVLEANGSCHSLVMLSWVCLVSLFLCANAGMRVVTKNGTFFFLKQQNATWCSRHVGGLLMGCIIFSWSEQFVHNLVPFRFAMYFFDLPIDIKQAFAKMESSLYLKMDQSCVQCLNSWNNTLAQWTSIKLWSVTWFKDL